MATPESDTSRYYRPELDVVRFLAFLLVFIHHELPADPDARIDSVLKGFAPILYAISDASRFGLSLFFTLSAFLICELLLRERSSTGTVGIKQFYIRRILRIWPLYYLGLTLCASVAILPGGHIEDLTKIGWFALFMGAWYIVTHGYFAQPVLPLWSISVEEQFYLFAPWVVKYVGRRLLYGFCAALMLIANVWLYFLGKWSASECRVWANSFVQFECFAAGILLCLVLRGRLPRLIFWQRLMLLAGALSCWLFSSCAFHVRFAANDNPGSWPLISGYALAALGSSVILVAFLGVDAKLLPGWTIYLGRISFGLYVYHKLAVEMTSKLLLGHVTSFGPIYLLKGVLALGLTFLMASLSYRFFGELYS